MMPPPPTPPPINLPRAAAFPPPLPTDEQRKNDLIAAKLSKLEGKLKSPNKKVASGEKNRHKLPLSPVLEVKKEPVQLDEDLPLTVARSANGNGQDSENKSKVAKKKKSGATVPNNEVSQACKKNSSENSVGSMSRSFRKKVPTNLV